MKLHGCSVTVVVVVTVVATEAVVVIVVVVILLYRVIMARCSQFHLYFLISYTLPSVGNSYPTC